MDDVVSIECGTEEDIECECMCIVCTCFVVVWIEVFFSASAKEPERKKIEK